MANNVETRNLGGYRASDQRNTFQYDTGVVVLPVASRTAGHKIIRLHGGLGLRTARWSMTREGKPPIIPTMADTSGDTFLSGSVSPALPVTSVTGQGYDWHVSGEYTYVQNTPRIVGTHAIPVGQHPFVDENIAVQVKDQFPLTSTTLSMYTGSTPFHTFLEAAAATVKTDATGNYQWPLLGIPTIFTSSLPLQD